MAKNPKTFSMVFHGGPAIIRRFSRNNAPCGFFFADRMEVAKSWALNSATSGSGFVVSAEVTLLDPLVIDAIARDAEAAGFDGMVVHNVQDGADTMDGATNTTIIALQPSQVRILNTAATDAA